MEQTKWFKLALSVWLAVIALGVIFILPAGADDPPLLGGGDTPISRGPLLQPRAGEAPAIDISSDGRFVAVVYKKPALSNIIYLKSATAEEGWLTVTRLGSGASPQLAFSRAMTDRVYAVWVSEDATRIKFAWCTVSFVIQPQCIELDDVHSGVDLATPDITVGLNGSGQDVVHLAWVDKGNDQRWVRTALSDTTRVVTSTISPRITETYDSPVLAGSGPVHLAFLSRPNLSESKHDKVVYLRSDNETGHTWEMAMTFAKDSSYHSDYQNVGRPAIAAAGNTVYLAWAADQQANDKGPFGLMRATYTGTNWTVPFHVTSDISASVVTETRYSVRLGEVGEGNPNKEKEGLRPRLAISGTDDLAIVWQQRPDSSGCSELFNSSSKIYLAYTNTTWISYTLDKITSTYSIAPDIAVGPDGQEHIVFMKETTGDCIGPDQYVIYYRGPITVTRLDEGECCAVYTPIILKNGS